jgi:hypothetical protein
MTRRRFAHITNSPTSGVSEFASAAEKGTVCVLSNTLRVRRVEYGWMGYYVGSCRTTCSVDCGSRNPRTSQLPLLVLPLVLY